MLLTLKKKKSIIILSNIHFIIDIIYFKDILMNYPPTQTHILTDFQVHYSTITIMRWKKKRDRFVFTSCEGFQFCVAALS